MGHLDSPPLPHKALGITYMGIAVRSHQWSWEHTEIVVWELYGRGRAASTVSMKVFVTSYLRVPVGKYFRVAL